MNYASTYASTYDNENYHGSGFASKDEFVHVNSAGYYEFDPPNGLTYRQFGRQDYYLSYNHSGEMLVKINQKTHEIGPGTVFIYPPFAEQYYQQKDNQLISNYWVHFTGFGIPELLLRSNLEYNQIYNLDVNTEIPGLIEEIIEEISRKQHDYQHVASTILQKLFFMISRKNQAKNNNNPNAVRDNRISNSIEFIHKNYRQAITVAELSEISCLSLSRYTAVFREIVGVSPQQYLVRYRLQKAKELLSTTDLSVGQIADLVGYPDQFHFSKIFKKHESATPLAYRKNGKAQRLYTP
ncbi:AraC family transcriptional regulator [Cohnella hongkongensis]|uniref:AraC family transcriptional regulator n=1 Tax=Cohnella hongkongensis TaxID=178337 RepID=A0ABV9FHN3_9BACL